MPPAGLKAKLRICTLEMRVFTGGRIDSNNDAAEIALAPCLGLVRLLHLSSREAIRDVLRGPKQCSAVMRAWR